MIDWHVNITLQAENDIDEIYRYIAYSLEEPGNAWSQIKRIREQIYKLDKMPDRFPIIDEEPWRSRGVRRINIDNYAAFYVIDEDSGVVVIIRVFYARRNIGKIL
jgi:toxin ParE1/3/4